jgi:hypothetical protein
VLAAGPRHQCDLFPHKLLFKSRSTAASGSTQTYPLMGSPRHFKDVNPYQQRCGGSDMRPRNRELREENPSRTWVTLRKRRNYMPLAAVQNGPAKLGNV